MSKTAFSLTSPAAVLEQKNCLHMKRVQSIQDGFGTQTWGWTGTGTRKMIGTISQNNRKNSLNSCWFVFNYFSNFNLSFPSPVTETLFQHWTPKIKTRIKGKSHRWEFYLTTAKPTFNSSIPGHLSSSCCLPHPLWLFSSGTCKSNIVLSIFCFHHMEPQIMYSKLSQNRDVSPRTRLSACGKH